MANRPNSGPSRTTQGDFADQFAHQSVAELVIELQKDTDMHWSRNSSARLARYCERQAARLRELVDRIRAHAWDE